MSSQHIEEIEEQKTEKPFSGLSKYIGYKTPDLTLKDQILVMVNEGMTIVSCPGEVSYTVTVADRNRKTANLHTLKERDPAAAEHLERLAKALKDPALSHTTPKVKIVVPKPPKAPRAKKGAK